MGDQVLSQLGEIARVPAATMHNDHKGSSLHASFDRPVSHIQLNTIWASQAVHMGTQRILHW